MYFDDYFSPLGKMRIASDGEAITGCWFEDQKQPPAQSERFPCPVIAQAKQWLDAYFQGERVPVTFPLRPDGTPFQKEVLATLASLAYGQTTTYQAVARQMNKGSARAVGRAVARNPILILIPCHRVLGANGKLTGYAGGLARKEALLRREGVLR